MELGGEWRIGGSGRLTIEEGLQRAELPKHTKSKVWYQKSGKKSMTCSQCDNQLDRKPKAGTVAVTGSRRLQGWDRLGQEKCAFQKYRGKLCRHVLTECWVVFSHIKRNLGKQKRVLGSNCGLFKLALTATYSPTSPSFSFHNNYILLHKYFCFLYFIWIVSPFVTHDMC